VNHPFLRAGEVEGQVVFVEVDQRGHFLENLASQRHLALVALPQQLQLHVEQFLKLQPELGRGQQLVVLRKVNLLQGLGLRHQPVVLNQLRRQRLGDVRQGQLQQLAHHAHDGFAVDAVVVFELLGGVVHRLQKALAGLILVYFLQLGVSHLGPPVEHRRLTENDVLLVVAGVLLHPFHALEPYQLQLAGAVAHLGRKALFRPFAHQLLAAQHAAHLHIGQVIVEVGYLVYLRTVEVAKWVALNQVAVGE
jgi:hypothetical protein